MNEGLEKILEEIRIDPEDKVKGFYTLLKTNSPFVCFKNEEYLVPKNALDKLREEGIKFKMKKDY